MSSVCRPVDAFIQSSFNCGCLQIAHTHEDDLIDFLGRVCESTMTGNAKMTSFLLGLGEFFEEAFLYAYMIHVPQSHCQITSEYEHIIIGIFYLHSYSCVIFSFLSSRGIAALCIECKYIAHHKGTDP